MKIPYKSTAIIITIAIIGLLLMSAYQPAGLIQESEHIEFYIAGHEGEENYFLGDVQGGFKIDVPVTEPPYIYESYISFWPFYYGSVIGDYKTDITLITELTWIKNGVEVESFVSVTLDAIDITASSVGEEMSYLSFWGPTLNVVDGDIIIIEYKIKSGEIGYREGALDKTFTIPPGTILSSHSYTYSTEPEQPIVPPEDNELRFTVEDELGTRLPGIIVNADGYTETTDSNGIAIFTNAQVLDKDVVVSVFDSDGFFSTYGTTVASPGAYTITLVPKTVTGDPTDPRDGDDNGDGDITDDAAFDWNVWVYVTIALGSGFAIIGMIAGNTWKTRIFLAFLALIATFVIAYIIGAGLYVSESENIILHNIRAIIGGLRP